MDRFDGAAWTGACVVLALVVMACAMAAGTSLRDLNIYGPAWVQAVGSVVAVAVAVAMPAIQRRQAREDNQQAVITACDAAASSLRLAATFDLSDGLVKMEGIVFTLEFADASAANAKIELLQPDARPYLAIARLHIHGAIEGARAATKSQALFLAFKKDANSRADTILHCRTGLGGA